MAHLLSNSPRQSFAAARQSAGLFPKLERMILALCCLGVGINGGAAVRGENWPEFRGPTGQGIATPQGLPLHWTETEHVAWKVPIEGLGWSSPIILDGRIYLTTAVPLKDGGPNEESLRALCLDARTGKQLWETEVFEQRGPTASKIHGKNSHASPTPLTDGKRLFVHFGTHGTACLDLNGKVLWRNQELKYAPVHGNGGSPILVDKRLIFSCDGRDVQFVVALDADTGKIRWKTERGIDVPKTFSFSTPLAIEFGGRKQIVSPGPGAVFSYDLDGRELWRVRYNGYSVIPRPVFDGERVFVSSSYDNPVVFAIRPDGKGDVTDTHVAWKLDKGGPHSASMLVVGTELYFVSDNGIAQCLDARTGDVHWKERVGGNYSASPLYADGRIYFQSEQGEAIVLKAGTTFEELARNPLPERTLASCAVSDGALFLRTDKHLYRIQAE
jgi:outer membrane protein assembly factor BamB